ncbi:unnamed protein product [Paramecium pentaurelia]|uniref:Uncharacterized protein n=1 Tax=Paramecium pentaurelia TaxID=43138 RepID=A0A8S1TXR5_9CILI|nr:unnamed protein product [Paramecium pentaurelia]
MPKHNPIYTPRFDEVLTELVGTLGEAKWAEITRQMKTIYGLSIPHKPMVQARWRAIDPKINRQIFSAEETVTHWHICVKYKCHWDAVKAEYEAIGQPSSLVEVNVQNVSDKLKQYSQLFNQDAMTKFAQLAAEQASGNAELHALGQDEGSSTDRQPGHNIGQLVYNALSDLEDQLKGSLANLEANEIAAYYQLADWLADTESEVVHLNDEIQRKTQLQDKLVVQEQAALAVQAKANSVLKDSQNAINAATASLQELRELYETELNRRNEENAIIDEVIHIFKQQVLEMANQTSFGKK